MGAHVMREEAARARYTAALKAAAADAVAKGDPVMQAASALSRASYARQEAEGLATPAAFARLTRQEADALMGVARATASTMIGLAVQLAAGRRAIEDLPDTPERGAILSALLLSAEAAASVLAAGGKPRG